MAPAAAPARSSAPDSGVISIDRRNLACGRRTGAFRKAIFQTVRRGDVVIDLGSGLGTYALFAAKAGARKVYVLEPGEIITVAEELARANGLRDRIEFIKGNSLYLDLPEKADVLLFDEIFDSFFVGGEIGEVIADARARFLKPGGKIIPARAELYAAPAQFSRFYAELDCLRPQKDKSFGLDVSLTRPLAMNKEYVHKIPASGLLASPRMLSSLDLSLDEISLDARAEFRVAKRGMLHGLCGWMKVVLAPGAVLSNDPRLPAIPWEQMVFPLERPVAVSPVDRVAVELKSSKPHQRPFWWQWNVEVRTRTGETIRRTQSTVHSNRRLDVLLAVARRDRAPRLSPQGRMDGRLLALCDGRRPLAEIAAQVHEEFPELCATPARAEARLSTLLLDAGLPQEKPTAEAALALSR